METMKLNFMGDDYELVIVEDKYSANDTLYLGLIDVNTYELFADITVNIPYGVAEENTQYVDTNSYCDVLKNIVKKYKLGTKVGADIQSGFCSYPLYKFNRKNIEKYLADKKTLRKAGFID